MNLPLYVQVKHQGYWVTNEEGEHMTSQNQSCDNNSVMLDPSCLLYVYKIALRHYLLSKGIITPDDIDAANLVPHIVVRKNKKDPFSKYHWIQNRSFLIEEKDLTAKNDFLMIELEDKLHMTLIFSKKIGKRVNLIECFKIIIENLNKNPEYITQYSNLKNFGKDHIYYWYHSPESYPHNIEKPPGYKLAFLAPLEYVTSPAGSVIDTIRKVQ